MLRKRTWAPLWPGAGGVAAPAQPMTTALRLPVCLIFFAAIVGAARAEPAASPPQISREQSAFFEEKIRPVLAEHCYDCHSARAKKVKGGLLLDTRAGWAAGGDSGDPAIVPGDPEKSLVVQAVRHDSDDLAMPPKKPKLPDAVIADLVQWIQAGAADPRTEATEAKRADKSWWSLRPLAAVEPPTPSGLPEAWRASGIDRFIFAKLAEKGLAPNPPADPRTLIRRVCYDLTGLPPGPKQVKAFAADTDPSAYEKLVERLLASSQYGEQWGRHWLDVVRFGESNGYERNFPIDNVWPFRDYVIRSFNDDKPFNRFVVEQLAGDVVGKGQPDVEVAVAFLTLGPWDDVGNQDAAAAANTRAVILDDIVTAAGTAFLGLTVNCARCHNHKFDPIPTEDYYRLKCAFEGVTHGERVLASAEEIQKHDAIAAPLEARKTELLAEKAAIEKASADDGKAKLAANAAQIAAIEAQIHSVAPLPKVALPIFNQPKSPSTVFRGGDPARAGAEVHPASLDVLSEVTKSYELASDAPEADRRLALAKWIASDDNPLTARVIANRLWHYHFGCGIVDTPGDFGFLGGKPAHPGLLDWLAQRLRADGWKIKAIQREIVLSQAYRQAGDYREDAAHVDKDARLLWRFPPRRLSAEELRDSMLAVSGRLDLRMGGPGFRLYQHVQDNVSTYTPLDKYGPETFRRAVYHQNVRASTVDLLSDFDLPDNSFAAPRRTCTTTPLQALTLLNHSFTLDMAEALGERIAPGEGDLAGQVSRGFELAFQREPSAAERDAAAALVKKDGLRAFCRALYNANEFIYLH